ncbi:hypothetical protein MLD38_035629 [Melastoma candidum]|uniref:Uncharacterized protein n=1 Tax=Melastoma candidum TaxID=119954 RepID=A0ACB9LIY5_9MYRT|nr:hypothetical protein MLD38_035629 [Melastoma candidum]
MLSCVGRAASACWRPVRRYARMNKDKNDSDRPSSRDVNWKPSDSDFSDPLVWSRDLEHLSFGELSFAVVQANEVLEDHSLVDAADGATFVGVFDGHGGPDAAKFVRDHLFLNLMRIARESGTISEDVIQRAYAATEEGFLTLVRRTCVIKPLIAAMGSCCLVGVIWRGTLYVGNVGDSRAVLGTLSRSDKLVAEQLTKEHNAGMEEVRQELRSLHPDDSQIVVMKHGVWRVKGIIQVSRSIGDAYLKRPEFSLDPSFPRFHLAEPLHRPVLTAEPTLCSRILSTEDKFVIFASDGLWEHISNQQAVEIVHNTPRAGIARRLVKVALNEVARKREMSFTDLKKVEKGTRRYFHDDITVVVLFLDHENQEEKECAPELSLRGFVDSVGPSRFDIFLRK